MTIKIIVRNQARQAYLIGNKTLAKELSILGQVHNLQMKAAQERGQEPMHRQRFNFCLSLALKFPSCSKFTQRRKSSSASYNFDEDFTEIIRNPDVQSNGKEQIIDLHGLNMSDSIFVLKRELGVLRNAARSLDQNVIISIRVGPTPARLLVAVQRYLLEEEGLDFYEPRPGLLRVVI